jgi:hypothetical protein
MVSFPQASPLDTGTVIKDSLPASNEGKGDVESREKLSTPEQYIFSFLKVYIRNYIVKRNRAATSLNESCRLLLASGYAVGALGWGTALQAGRSPVPFPSGLTIAMGSTQLLTEISTSTGLFKMIVGALTTCHTQYTWDNSICIFFI